MRACLREGFRWWERPKNNPRRLKGQRWPGTGISCSRGGCYRASELVVGVSTMVRQDAFAALPSGLLAYKAPNWRPAGGLLDIFFFPDKLTLAEYWVLAETDDVEEGRGKIITRLGIQHGHVLFKLQWTSNWEINPLISSDQWFLSMHYEQTQALRTSLGLGLEFFMMLWLYLPSTEVIKKW